MNEIPWQDRFASDLVAEEALDRSARVGGFVFCFCFAESNHKQSSSDLESLNSYNF